MKVVQTIYNVPTPLRRTMKIHHVSSIENACFDPIPVTPCSTRQSPFRPVCRRLTCSPSDDNNISEDEVSSPHSTPQIQYPTPDTRSLPSKHTLAAYKHLEEADEEEDFQTVPLDDKHWTTEEIPDRPLCIYEHPLPHRLCPYPCLYKEYQTSSYYKSMELSDISNFEDLMTTSSDEDIPVLKDNTYWVPWFELIIIYINYKLLIYHVKFHL